MELDLLENIYFILGLIITLSILVFWLTLIGQKYNKKYTLKYFQIESYDLNPLYGNIGGSRKIKLRYLISCIVVIILSVFVILTLHNLDNSKNTYEFFLGLLIISYITLISKNLSSIAISIFIGKNPDLLKGQIEYKKGYLSFISMFGCIPILLILLFVLLFSPSMFVLGGFASILLLFIRSLIWHQNTMKKVKTI